MKDNNFNRKLLTVWRKFATGGWLFLIILLLILFNIGCGAPGSTGNLSGENSNTTSDVPADTKNVTEDAVADENTADAASNDEQESEAEEENSMNEENLSTEGNQNQDEEQPDTQEGDLNINVYYADSQVKYLVGESRKVSSSSRYVEALNELMKLPVDSSLIRLIPATTVVNSVTVEDGIAKVDLSDNFVQDRATSDTEDVLLVYSIVNTLTGFSDIDAVNFYIDGEKLDALGMLDLQNPCYRRSDLIKS